jgi:hypothetical protein
MAEMINAYKMFVRKSEGKKLLRRHRIRLGGDIKMDLKETVCQGVGWVHLPQDGVQWGKHL